jgi:hypothetical protein
MAESRAESDILPSELMLDATANDGHGNDCPFNAVTKLTLD